MLWSKLRSPGHPIAALRRSGASAGLVTGDEPAPAIGRRRALRAAGITRPTSVLIVADTALYRDGLALSLARRKVIRVLSAPIGPETWSSASQ